MAIPVPLLTLLALFAFAANSIICRYALHGQSIDALAFTAIRLASGAAMLGLIVVVRGQSGRFFAHGNWRSALALFAYAIAFSFAYVELDAGVGALILFAAVQLTMIGWALLSGERPGWLEWVGLVTAMTGLVYLVSPGLSAPPLAAAALMAIAGAAWGIYSLRGRASRDALRVTAANFVFCIPPALVIMLLFASQLNMTGPGVVLAVASGAIASGLGYVIWYAALEHLSSTRAATVQLAVPVIAALGGIVLLDESPGWRLLVSTILILGGIAMATLSRTRKTVPERC